MMALDLFAFALPRDDDYRLVETPAIDWLLTAVTITRGLRVATLRRQG